MQALFFGIRNIHGLPISPSSQIERNGLLQGVSRVLVTPFCVTSNGDFCLNVLLLQDFSHRI